MLIPSLAQNSSSTSQVIICAVIKNYGSHFRCKVTNKCLNVREWVEVVEKNKDGASLLLLSHESSVFVKSR